MAALQTVMNPFSSKAPNLGLGVLWGRCGQVSEGVSWLEAPKMAFPMSPQSHLIEDKAEFKSECL